MLISSIITLFVLMLIIFDERGFTSVKTLICNGIILSIGIYLMFRGGNPYIITFIMSVFITYLTLLFQNGKNIKTYAALFSVIILMILLSVFIYFFVTKMHIAGFSEAERASEEYMYLRNDIKVSMTSLMVAVVIIGLLGAVMDTAIAITSTVYEVYRHNNKLSFTELIKSGKNVGHEIVGTTANTLLFAGMGESLMLFIWLIRMKNYSFLEIINSKVFIQEIIIILVSNIGCLLIIPISAIIISYLIKKKGKKYENNAFIGPSPREKA